MLTVDRKYLIDTFFSLVSVPSPVGYHVEANPRLAEIASALGEQVTLDRRGNASIRIAGEDPSQTVVVAAHMDTLGLMVSGIAKDGTLCIRSVGGPNLHSAESENVTVLTRSGKRYTGILMCKSHSVHAFDDARTKERTDENMMVLLDEPVSSRADTEALGVCVGDFIALDAHPVLTEKGFLKSRFIDDKAMVACALTAIKAMKDEGRRPKYNTVFAFTYYEENSGGMPLPDGVTEILGLDIGLVSPINTGTEHTVSICAKDFATVYDYTLTGELITLAERTGCAFVTDIHYRYGSDVGVALRSGCNARGALIGPGVYGSHGVERTHIDGLESTAKLLLAYLTERES